MLGVAQYFNNKSELELPTNNCSQLWLSPEYSLSPPSVCLFFSVSKFTVIYMIIHALYFHQIDLF